MAVTGSIALIGAGIAVYQGQQADKANRRNVRDQQAAQQQATARAASQQRQVAFEQAQANRKQPDVASLLLDELSRQNQGVGSTLLTSGIPKLRLGRKSLLGGGDYT